MLTRRGGGVPARLGGLVALEDPLACCVLALAYDALDTPDGTNMRDSLSELLLLELWGRAAGADLTDSTQPSAARNTASHVAMCSGAPVVGL